MSKEMSMEMVKGSTFSGLVKVEGEKIFTTSDKVAEVFGKQHKDVIRAIEKLSKDEAVSCRRIFALTSIEVKQPNGGSRKEKAYEMTRDGFALLAMGFTGEKALRFKLGFIDEFNAMETGISKLKESLMIDNAINIATRALSTAHESQTKALIGTVREQEALLESKENVIKSQRKVITVLSEKTEMVHKVGELDDKGRIKGGVRRPTAYVLPNMESTSQSIQTLAAKLHDAETYIDYNEDNEPVQLRFEFNARREV